MIDSALSEEVTRQVTARYDATAYDYARIWSPVLRPMAQSLLRALPLAAAGNILDIGAGAGALLPDLRKAAPKAAIVGIDLSEGMLRMAQALRVAPVARM